MFLNQTNKAWDLQPCPLYNKNSKIKTENMQV